MSLSKFSRSWRTRFFEALFRKMPSEWRPKSSKCFTQVITSLGTWGLIDLCKPSSWVSSSSRLLLWRRTSNWLNDPLSNPLSDSCWVLEGRLSQEPEHLSAGLMSGIRPLDVRKLSGSWSKRELNEFLALRSDFIDIGWWSLHPLRSFSTHSFRAIPNVWPWTRRPLPSSWKNHISPSVNVSIYRYLFTLLESKNPVVNAFRLSSNAFRLAGFWVFDRPGLLSAKAIRVTDHDISKSTEMY